MLTWTEWIIDLMWYALTTIIKLPRFARINPYRVNLRSGFSPLRSWHDVISTWEPKVTVVRYVSGTTIEGDTQSLRNAYNDPNVYIQCGLKDVVDPHDSPVWEALDPADRYSISTISTSGPAIFGRFERVATFITPKRAAVRITYTHYDEYNGFLCVVRGTKTVFVAPPAACANHDRLKPNETPQTPFDTPGFTRYDVKAGDILYIPKGFWHYVLTPADTVLITFWFY